MTLRIRAGMTLIELMVTMAIFSILMLAAMSIFVAMSETQRLNERITEASSNRLVALSSIQLDLQNAGFRLPVPAFALRVFNNVDGTLSLPSNVGTVTTTIGCGTGGIVPGTDVLELAFGPDNVLPGFLDGVGPDPDSPTVTFGGGRMSPLRVFGLGDGGFDGDTATTGPQTAGPILVFARGPGVPPAPVDDGALCMARLSTSPAPPSLTVTVRYVTPDGNDAPAGYYANCPTPGMRVYRVFRKVRYMVCGPAGAPPTQLALFRQFWQNGVWIAPPEEVQVGVENLQVAGRYLNSSAPALVASPTTSPSCIGAGARALCYCNDRVGGCDVAQPPAAGPLGPLSPAALIRGARVQLTATGDRAALSNTGAQNFRRPASFDQIAAAGPGDNFVRIVDTVTFSGSNFLVTP